MTYIPMIMTLSTITTAGDSSEFPLFTVAAVSIVIMGVVGYFLRSKFK